jgi:hypothetical protein
MPWFRLRFSVSVAWSRWDMLGLTRIVASAQPGLAVVVFPAVSEIVKAAIPARKCLRASCVQGVQRW